MLISATGNMLERPYRNADADAPDTTEEYNRALDRLTDEAWSGDQDWLADLPKGSHIEILGELAAIALNSPLKLGLTDEVALQPVERLGRIVDILSNRIDKWAAEKAEMEVAQ